MRKRIPPFLPRTGTVWLVDVKIGDDFSQHRADGVVYAGNTLQLNLEAGGILRLLPARIHRVTCVPAQPGKSDTQATFDLGLPDAVNDGADLELVASCRYGCRGLTQFAAANKN